MKNNTLPYVYFKFWLSIFNFINNLKLIRIYTKLITNVLSRKKIYNTPHTCSVSNCVAPTEFICCQALLLYCPTDQPANYLLFLCFNYSPHVFLFCFVCFLRYYAQKIKKFQYLFYFLFSFLISLIFVLMI